MAGISPNVNKKELFEELRDAVEADKLYWIRNDAKIRNVVTAKTYDEFRDNVAGAHLTPVTQKDWKKKGNTSWNTAIHNKHTTES